MTLPSPTPILRLIHIDNLAAILARGCVHASNHTPDDGHAYRGIHRNDVQNARHQRPVQAGPRGTLHDYVPFYFGCRSVMLFQLKTGRVDGYGEGQAPLVYLVATAQAVDQAGLGFVFTDGHALAGFTGFFDDLAQLDQVDWSVVGLQYWKDTAADPDRQRKKQAEFLVHRELPWALVQEVAVLNEEVKGHVEALFARYPAEVRKPVVVRAEWYYP